ncbi:Sb-PDE family phosphodiesterase [Opitutus sp. ER46]|uniref:Sb-PDE family phosphodiesterase n=1 Tax=Opitutus sp. ER46 TaxID=2161864 RepID=UPI000D3109A4|nr:Sb-PDE family phosphodiesterase [Opitutus sp. ER46]PTX95597.1 PHP domain-containing protein [Opitutus sp. ER46]
MSRPLPLSCARRCRARHLLLTVVALTGASALLAAPAEPRPASFRNPAGYEVLKCDFHIHTVFSDGQVWPTTRVAEAARDGLDAIAITDHREKQRFSADVTTAADANRSATLALEAAKANKVIVIRGTEITRSMPPGHGNAIFAKDAAALYKEEPIDAYRAARAQDCFVFWNHPHWIVQAHDGVARLSDLHRQLLKEGLLQGIEIVNEDTYSDEALQIALDHNLTILGNSDIHSITAWVYEGSHRPTNLVFVKERSEAGIKDALVNRRTVVWFANTLVGRPEWLEPLLGVSIVSKSAHYAVLARTGKPVVTSVLNVELENTSDVDFILQNRSAYTLHENADVLTLPRHSTKLVQVKTVKHLPEVVLTFEVLNAVTAPGKHGSVTLTVQPKAP